MAAICLGLNVLNGLSDQGVAWVELTPFRLYAGTFSK